MSKRYGGPKQVKEAFGFSEAWLAQRRMDGKGPPFMKICGRVMYDLDEVETWMAAQRRHSTSEYDTGTHRRGRPRRNALAHAG